jgi:hypothetical protein
MNLLYPKALPYRVPDYLWYLVHVEEAVVKGGAPGVRLPPPGRPVRPGALPGVEPGLLRARGPWDPPGLGIRQEGGLLEGVGPVGPGGP